MSRVVTEDDLTLWLTVCLLAAVAAMLRQWRSGGAGLLFTYVVSFFALHWLVPALYLLPWFVEPDLPLTVEGLRQSAIAMVAFAAGAQLVRIAHASDQPAPADLGVVGRTVSPRLVTIYLATGFISYVVIAPFSARLASISAVVSTGATLMAAAVGLKAWNAWQSGQLLRMWLWLGGTVLFPLVTVAGQGFLGYGFAATMVVFAFVASFYRPRWVSIALFAAMAYGGLSVYVTYMRDRTEIRDVVWSGAPIDHRLAQITETLGTAEWFDLQDRSHLARITKRLNQDYLVGAAVAFLREGRAQFADGGTVVEAMLALVPRALWPGKPIVGGSGSTVTTYTGIRFAEGTSVGVGQVMEFHINFGTAGVALGFLMIGGLVVLVDRRAASALVEGDARRFLLWYLPGLSLLQIGGALSEVVATAGASIVMAVTLGRLTLPAPLPVRFGVAPEGAAGDEIDNARPEAGSAGAQGLQGGDR